MNPRNLPATSDQLCAQLAAGQYDLRAQHAHWPGARASGVVAGAEDVTITFHPAAFISGRVVDRGGDPIGPMRLQVVPALRPGAARTFGGQAGLTWVVQNRHGAFQVGPLNPGEYHLLARSALGGAGLVSGIVLAPGQRRRDVQVTVGAGATLRGQVIDGQTGARLADVAITLREQQGIVHARTNAAGEFSIEGLPPGRPVDLLVRRAPDYPPEVRTVDVPAREGLLELGAIALRRAPR